MSKKVIVIGGNAAGLSAASQIKRQHPQWTVTVFEKGRYISYGACGIPYYIEGLVPGIENLITLSASEAINKRKLDIRLNHPVTAIDPITNTVTVDSPDGEIGETFDYLVIATGARPLEKGIDYQPSQRVCTVNDLPDAEKLNTALEEFKPRNCAIIGGGYIAIEMLEAMLAHDLETHLIHRRDQLARSFEPEISELALTKMADQGAILQLNQPVEKIVESGKTVAVTTCNGDQLVYDLVIVATGVRPNSELAADCGIELGVRGSIKVNNLLQTNYNHIYACGDCAETKQIITGAATYLPLALKANKEGVIAGVNISGGKEMFPGVLATAITKFADLGLARTGLTLTEAEEAGFAAVKVKVETNSKAHYYPGSGKMTIVLVADQISGRLLGAQLAGPVDSVKRIDTLATAISAEMNLDQIFHLDLAYAPPFAPVYDPVVLSARVGRKKVEN